MRESKIFKRPDSLIVEPQKAREAILILRNGYIERKLEHRLYNDEDYIPENIISMYYYFISHSNYQIVVKNYKKEYIENESIVEPGVTKEERKGLGIIYDYISGYDFKGKDINVFVESLLMHMKLYSKCPHPEFGGTIRTNAVYLKNSNYEVPNAIDAQNMFQNYVNFKLDIMDDNIIDYIDEAIRVTIDLIKIQPFADGNKRTFRALLNLLLGKCGIPPTYIKKSEREIYKTLLIDAIERDDLKRITRFYYYKICDSIVELDLLKLKEKKTNGKSLVIKKR